MENNHCYCCNFVVIVLTGLERAGCSCADPASKLGRCKHAVGLLLWCKNEKNVRYLEAMLEFYVALSVDISFRYYLYGEHTHRLRAISAQRNGWNGTENMIVSSCYFFWWGGGGLKDRGRVGEAPDNFCCYCAEIWFGYCGFYVGLNRTVIVSR